MKSERLCPYTVGSPLDAGIPPEAILRFLDRLDEAHVNMHSVLLYRRGILAAEGYYAPCSANSLHRMFSVCKTLTALAVGLLEEEGRLSLSDPIIRYFPDKLPDQLHPWVSSMTIQDMLMMRTCHASTTYKNAPDKDWLASFFHTAPTHKPGTVFHYDTSAAHVLCALTERLSGMPMLDYLRRKCLNRIGWSETSYILTNVFGDTMGGSGLMATSRDLLLLGILLLQKGCICGEQLLPHDFVVRMTSCLTPTALTGGVVSEAQGYGYQLYQNARGGFVCYGMGGQLVICLPKEELILVTTADTQGMGGGNDLIYNSLYEEILPALDRPAAKEDSETMSALSRRLSGLTLHPLYGFCRTLPSVTPCSSFLSEYTAASRINGRIFHLMPNPHGFSEICLTLTEQTGTLTYCYQGRHASLAFGLTSCIPGQMPFYDMAYAASGIWLSENTFYLKVALLDTSVGSLHMEFCFGENDVTLFFKKIEETLFTEFSGHFYGT